MSAIGDAGFWASHVCIVPGWSSEYAPAGSFVSSDSHPQSSVSDQHEVAMQAETPHSQVQPRLESCAAGMRASPCTRDGWQGAEGHCLHCFLLDNIDCLNTVDAGRSQCTLISAAGAAAQQFRAQYAADAGLSSQQHAAACLPASIPIFWELHHSRRFSPLQSPRGKQLSCNCVAKRGQMGSSEIMSSTTALRLSGLACCVD